MKKNTLLKVAIVICKIIRVSYIVIFLIFTGVFVHLQMNPSSYEKVKFNIETVDDGTFLQYKYSDYIKEKEGSSQSQELTLDKMKISSLYFNFIKTSLLFWFTFLCVKEFQAIIESVKAVKTFQENNVLSFRKIGKYLLFISVITMFTYYTFKNGARISCSVSYKILVLSLISYIMAEVFKEGNNLEEENKLTV
ncbi:DUF2975 domain-containing protein [Wenyingzhuangia sp. 1_MG-2023]|nr:DUF2975 domain-containing protein [Wenyingzhuangia sp. 1_MG-2023]